MAVTLSLEARPREAGAAHNHALRRSGQVPAVLYGHNRQPIALAADERAAERIWQRAGRTHLVDLVVDGKKPAKVLIREFQRDPRTAKPLHIDFFAVNLREKLTADVPVTITGEAPAVSELKIGVLTQILNTIKVECLPSDLPAHIAVDVSGLAAIDDGIHVRDLQLPAGVVLSHVDPDELVVKVAALRTAVEEAAPAAAEAAAGAEAAAPEGAAAGESAE